MNRHWKGTWSVGRCRGRIEVMGADRPVMVQCTREYAHDGAHQWPSPGKGRPLLPRTAAVEARIPPYRGKMVDPYHLSIEDRKYVKTLRCSAPGCVNKQNRRGLCQRHAKEMPAPPATCVECGAARPFGRTRCDDCLAVVNRRAEAFATVWSSLILTSWAISGTDDMPEVEEALLR